MFISLLYQTIVKNLNYQLWLIFKQNLLENWIVKSYWYFKDFYDNILH